MIIASYCDNFYVNYMYVLMKSAHLYVPDAHLYCLLVNCNSKQDSMLREVAPGIEIEHESVKFDSKDVHKMYMYRRRIKLWNKLVNERVGSIFCPDADTIIRKPCPELVKHLGSCDLTMRVKNHTEDFMDEKKISFAGSTLGFKCLPVAKRFLQEFAEYNRHDFREFATMRTLSKAFNDIRDLAVTFKHLPRELCSPWHDENDKIWEGNGQKKSLPRWREESKRIMDL